MIVYEYKLVNRSELQLSIHISLPVAALINMV